MDMGIAGRRRPEPWGRSGGPITSARPLVRPAPRSAMFFPLVVLVAVLPGLYALNWWDLTPPGPWWGVRALSVLDGRLTDQTPEARGLSPAEAEAYLRVAYQPPLLAWLAAVGLALTPDRSPWATAVPGYLAGAAVVILVYLHGRLWRGPGVGLAAAILTGCNRSLLMQMQQASPATLALAASAAALYAYGRHLRGGPGAAGGWPWGGDTAWLVVGGLALGLGLLAEGGTALLVLPVALLHQAYLLAEASGGDRPIRERLRLSWRDNPSMVAGGLVVAIGLLVAGPWHVRMLLSHGRAFAAALLAPPGALAAEAPGLLSRLVHLAPATLPLGLYAAVATIRRALVAEEDDRAVVGGVLWALWLAVATLVPAVWPGGPRATLDLFLLLPLNLLAAQAMADLAHRVVPVRALNLLAPASAVCIAWWISGNLRSAVADLIRGRLDSSAGLGLHLALDLLIAVVLFTRGLDRWAHRRDDRQRAVLAGYLGVVLAATVGGGFARLAQVQPATRDYLDLREVILPRARDRDRPIRRVEVIGPDPVANPPGPDSPAVSGRLRFVLRSALPGITPRHLALTDDLLALPVPGPDDGARLVILVGTEQRLSYSVQARLDLEAIYPGTSGLDAFATPLDPAPTRAR